MAAAWVAAAAGLSGKICVVGLKWQINCKMQEDLKKGLLGKKGGAFEKQSEECFVRIQRIKQKNDVMQKQIGTEIEEEIREEVHAQRDFIEKEINELKTLLAQMENKYKDPESKNRMKQIKLDATKQIERNKVILKDLINKSFIRRSSGRPQQEDGEQLMEGGQTNFQAVRGRKEEKESMLTDQQIEIDYELERKILLEKNVLINEVEQSTQRINEIMNDMGIMVDEQGEQLDVISEELMKTNQNMVATNDNLEEAQTLQKKARKKYTCLIALILIILLIAGGVLFFILT